MNENRLEALAVLAVKVEEAARSTEEGVRYFIEPAPGTLQRAIAKRHHIIFGRRGSGKSSLLRKAGADLTVDRRPIALVNLETFKSHSYPDVLLSVLIATFQEFCGWLGTAAINPASKARFWLKLFNSTPNRPAFNRKMCNALKQKIENQIAELTKQLYATDQSNLTVTRSGQSEGSAESSLGTKAGSEALGINAGMKTASKIITSDTTQETYKKEKIDFLLRHIMEYQQIFREMAQVSGGDAYLFLDDLYQIGRSDQPSLIDYFHRIAKDNRLWLKIGTIRHRSDWYLLGNPPIGVKLGDDADDIDLDVTLEKYTIAKKFLLSILRQFAVESRVNLHDLLTDGAQDRLVLASGGVARDFLAIFRKSIQVCLEDSSDRITAEHVNEAAGEYETSKREDFRRDSAEDQERLNESFQDIINFCISKNKTNCILIDKNAIGPDINSIHELVDLKLLHLARSRVTVRSRPGDIFEAYMLDFSQYSGARKRRGLEVIEFWKSEDDLRKASLIYSRAAETAQQV